MAPRLWHSSHLPYFWNSATTSDCTAMLHARVSGPTTRIGASGRRHLLSWPERRWALLALAGLGGKLEGSRTPWECESSRTIACRPARPDMRAFAGLVWK